MSERPSAMRGNQRAFRLCELASVVIAMLVGFDFLPSLHWAGLPMRLLENRFAAIQPDEIRSAAGVIALGGGAERIREAGRLARQYPHLKVIVSELATADEIRDVLGPGIDENRILIDTLARNTRENARYVLALAAPRADERWVLVTSASHMPRAVGAFRKIGMKVLAWPVPDEPKPWRSRSDMAQHEWIGLIWYRVVGASSSMFPGPSG